MKVYLAGPMTGYFRHNYPLFFEASQRLRDLGYEVENPADNDGATLDEALSNVTTSGHTWEWYLKRDIARLLDCEAVVVLPGWRQSRGATLEVNTARALGMDVLRYDQEAGALPLYTIVGLSGYARVGKDTAAQTLVEEKGYTKVAFADVLREALFALNPTVEYKKDPFPLASLIKWHGYERCKEHAPQMRELLQRMGTEVGRNLLGPNVWVDAALSKLEDGGKYVFTDCRFDNEAEAIQRLGGSVWRIDRPGVEAVNAHASETALDKWEFDAYIVNWGTPDDLARSVRRCVREQG